MHTVYVITGQTATGKTTYAIELSKQINGEVICADSRQIYKEMDIITGKDREEYIRNQVPVHMIDVTEPSVRYSSYEYVKDARSIVVDILKRGKVPIIVGGTYLYIQHLIDGITNQVQPDEQLRKKLEKLSVGELQARLKNTQLNQSDWNNPRRLIRKIEIENTTIKDNNILHVSPLTEVLPTVEFAYIGFRYATRESLVAAITQRVDARLKQGAIEEVRILMQNYSKNSVGLQTIGYKQIVEYLQGKTTIEKAREVWITKEVQYAKRQYTFMKKNERIKWQNVD